MRHTVRVFGGATLLAAAGLWRFKGPQWRVVARLGPLPDLMLGDVVTVPFAAAGFGLLAWLPTTPLRRRVAGVGGVVAAILWVTSEFPWDDPLIPFLSVGRHGVHVLDALAVVPLLYGASILVPWRLRWSLNRPGHVS